MPFGSEPASRHFIDLIYNSSAKWANWDPPKIVKVGDYGKLQKKTGQFEREGNIYEDEEFQRWTAGNPPEKSDKEQEVVITSSKVRMKNITLEPEGGFAALASVSFKARFTFGKTRGAVLIMSQPVTHSIPPARVLKYLADNRGLQDMSLVTEVITCPAYYLFLSNKEGSTLDVSLRGTAPIPVAPGMFAGASIGLTWDSQDSAGMSRKAVHPEGKPGYQPLFNLKRIRKQSVWKIRGETAPPPDQLTDDDLWEDEQKPWEPLDEDGEEQHFIDTVHD